MGVPRVKPWLSFGFLIPGYLERRALCSCRTVLGVLSLSRSCTVYPAAYPGRSLSDESVGNTSLTASRDYIPR